MTETIRLSRLARISKGYTVIVSNGSKWYGEKPDTLSSLIHRLQSEPLDKRFEDLGNFILDDQKTPGGIRFFGNFAHTSHVFDIRTKNPAIIQLLTGAIRTNQQRPDYHS